MSYALASGMKLRTLIVTAWLLVATGASAQYRAADGGEGLEVQQDRPCLNAEERREIQAHIDRNVTNLYLRGILPMRNQLLPVGLDWPLQAAASLPDPGYHGTTNFVDHDPSFPGSLLDYECGERTYDTSGGYNHQGVDVRPWPFWWYKMDRDEVEIVAAAPGTIVFKQDGNFDRSCNFGGSWNAVYVQHSDSSVAWYGHMKSGSLTPKVVGDPVVAGEYLGIVGSSGSSTNPHLHFEIYDENGSLNDPYSGSCNSMNPSSWWNSQPPYYDSAVNKLATHSSPPIFPPCPETEIPNFKQVFAPGDTGRFAAYYRDQLSNQVTTYTIKDPADVVVHTWNHSFASPPHYRISWWFWNRVIPGDAVEGTWKFEAEYEGQTYTHTFGVAAVIFEDGFESGDTSAWN